MSHPPNTGPRAVVIAVKPDQVPIARPRFFSPNEALIIARLLGTIAAAPIPCTERAMMSWEIVEEMPQAPEATANNAVPSTKVNRRPTESPKAPPIRMRTHKARAYDSTTQLNVYYARVQARLNCRQRYVDYGTVNERHARAENSSRQNPGRFLRSARRSHRCGTNHRLVARLFHDSS